MPELPEVETISRSLDKLVKGRSILKARLIRARLAPDTRPASFARLLKNKRINSIHRRGKHILFDLSGERTLIVHLRMSGRFSLLDSDDQDPKFSHAIFYLDDGKRLVFDDQRHFGLMKVVDTSLLYEARELKKLAPEPFSDEFTVEYLRAALKGSKRSLKEILLDQTKVCGLGNIYASEAMHAAGVHPAKRSDKLSRPVISRLYASILAVLHEALLHSDTMKIDRRNLEGSYFSAADSSGWLVYDREGEPCRRCKQPITRLKQAGRSTFLCRRCQRA